MLHIGSDENILLKKQDETLLSRAELQNMHEWDVDQKDELNFWINKLEQYNVYFSAPLDLDFMLLESFETAYKETVDDSYGPTIKNIGKIKDIETEKMSREYEERITKDIKATLKEEGGDGHTYTQNQRKLMIWYKYLFLSRGKPSTHLTALPNCSIQKIQDIPNPLRKIISKIADRKF